MSKARQLADNGAATPNRNMVINGAMNVAQRGTSSTGLGASNGYFTLDRWKLEFDSTAGRLDMTQTADGPSGFLNCLNLAISYVKSAMFSFNRSSEIELIDVSVAVKSPFPAMLNLSA